MPEFLKLLPPQEALVKWLAAIPEPATAVETVATIEAVGRVIGVDITAPHPLPEFTRSTRDGFAVRAADTYGASDSLPAFLTVIGEVSMGAAPAFSLGKGQAALIHTGGMLPPNADAVVMLEYTQITRPGEVEIFRPVAPLENIIQVGEDVQTGQVVIARGALLRPAEIGGLLAFGIQSVQVVRPPRVGILSSGDEVVEPEVEPALGQIRDINSYSLSAFVSQWGGVPQRYGILPDQQEALGKALAAALSDCDAVIVTAGSSASARDMTALAIQQAGCPGVLVHGVNVHPGKPSILGVCDGKPVVGLPGNPISALVIAWLFLPSMFAHLLGRQRPIYKGSLQARLDVNVPSLAGREDWIAVQLLADPDDPSQWIAEPVFFKSNLIFNLVNADGLMYIPADVTGFSAGESVQVYLI